MSTDGIITALSAVIAAVGSAVITWITTWLNGLKKKDNSLVEKSQNGNVLKYMKSANDIFQAGHEKKDFVLKKVARDCVSKGQHFDYLFWSDRIDELAKIAKGV